jgi:hypothetical protein
VFTYGTSVVAGGQNDKIEFTVRPGLGQPLALACVQAHVMHAAEEVLPMLGLYVPAGQSMQASCEAPIEYLPAGHNRHAAGAAL